MDKRMKARIDELIERYEALSEDINWRYDDEFNPYDASGGNFDDAYYMGVEHGEVDGALHILRLLAEEFKENS